MGYFSTTLLLLEIKSFYRKTNLYFRRSYEPQRIYFIFMQLLTTLIPFLFYPAVFISLFIQYNFNLFLGLILGLSSALLAFFMNRKLKQKNGIRKIDKGINLLILCVICLVLTVNIWGQAIEMKMENFMFQTITLILTLGLCAYSLVIELANKREEPNAFYERVSQLLNEVYLVLCACISSVITGIFLILMLRMHQTIPWLEPYTSRFLQRGIIPPLTLFLFLLGILLLFSKYLKLRQEDHQIQKIINHETDHYSVLYNSLMRSTNWKLDHEKLEAFMNLVWSKFNSFYNLPRYLTWAIPILGFLGTVLGISLTAEGISKMVNSDSGLVELSTELGNALSPLGIAFDTTLVALSLSLILVFIQLVMQRWEEKILVNFEAYMENSIQNQ